MGQMSMIRAIYTAMGGANSSTSPTYVTYPTLAAPVSCAGGKSYAYGAWATLLLAAGNTVEGWLAAVETSEGLVDDYQVQIGTGAIGSEAGLVQTPTQGSDVNGWLFPLPFPIYIPPNIRIAARAANASAAAFNTISVRVVVARGLSGV